MDDFRAAVNAIDAGDIEGLRRLLDSKPNLATERLEGAPDWLRAEIGDALDTFFARPFLSWFCSEDAVRRNRLPDNIVDITALILHHARGSDQFQEQVDYGLRLVAWSWVAAQSGRQNDLLDVFLDAGANREAAADALVNGHFDAARHLVERGATVTLPVAACLGLWDSWPDLVTLATSDQLQFSLVLASLRGRDDGVRRLLAAGADPNTRAKNLYSHASPLHHAVCSGSLDTVKLLVEAGSRLHDKDSAWGATPLDWANHYIEETKDADRRSTYQTIAEYLSAVQ